MRWKDLDDIWYTRARVTRNSEHSRSFTVIIILLFVNKRKYIRPFCCITSYSNTVENVRVLFRVCNDLSFGSFFFLFAFRYIEGKSSTWLYRRRAYDEHGRSKPRIRRWIAINLKYRVSVLHVSFRVHTREVFAFQNFRKYELLRSKRVFIYYMYL